jgi:UDP-N-acetyl-D-mannosaminuronic acid dehydrogenase
VKFRENPWLSLFKMKVTPENWKVEKIAVIGPGIVGMPMAAMLAHAGIRIGSNEPAKVIVIQRNSPTSGWKVEAINSGKSVIGGIEPGLELIVAESVAEGLLCASHNYCDLSDADVILVCIQTDKKQMAPDYGPMFEGLTGLAKALQGRPDGKLPLIIFESTLAPSSMATVIREHFKNYGLEEGRDILLGNSPNRVMPGRLIERVADSDKLVGGLNAVTPKLIKKLYENIVTSGTLHLTNSLTAEIVKTLENAYRDVRIAFAAEIARYCDANGIDFYQVRNRVNRRLAQADGASDDPNAVPSGGLLIPSIGVGGHCLPKDGILLLWRQIESDLSASCSLILESRRINDESPSETLNFAEKAYGNLKGRHVALMGTAYRFNSEDTRNSPTLNLASLLIEKGSDVILHDPFVRPDDQMLIKFGLHPHFTNDMETALKSVDVAIFCTAHREYLDSWQQTMNSAKNIFDACNLFRRSDLGSEIAYAGIGRGTENPTSEFVEFVYNGFRIVERGVANELKSLINFVNERFSPDDFSQVEFKEVQRIAGTCVTGCNIAEPGPITKFCEYRGFVPRLVKCGIKSWSNHEVSNN